jgi:hypothetical protein
MATSRRMTSQSQSQSLGHPGLRLEENVESGAERPDATGKGPVT